MSDADPGAAPPPAPDPGRAAADGLADVEARERRVRTVCLVVLTAIAAGAALYALQDVMVPFALASFLAIAFAPLVDGLAERTRLSRPIAVGVAMLLGALLLAILGGVVASSIREFNASAFSPDATGAPIGAPADDAPETTVADAVLDRFGIAEDSQLRETVGAAAERVSGAIPALVALLGTVLGQGMTVLIFLMFLLIEQGRPAQRPGGGGGPLGLGDTVRDRVKRYISVKVMTSLVTGIGVGVTLWAIGAPMPLLLGLLTFLLNFVPTIGSIIAVALPVPLLLADGAGVGVIALAIASPSAIQFAVGQVWENKLLGDAFDLRASVVLLALVFWGKVWGIIGMLLATPITAVLKTLMEDWDLTRPLARAMGQAVPDAPERVEGAPPGQGST